MTDLTPSDRAALRRAADLLRGRYEYHEEQADGTNGDRFDAAADTIDSLLIDTLLAAQESTE